MNYVEHGTKTMSKKAGYTSLILSCLLWCLIPILAFTDLPNKIGIGIFLYAMSYIFFFWGGYVLGKDVVQKLKNRVKALFPWGSSERNGDHSSES